MTIRTRLALTYGAAVAITIAVLGTVVWLQFGQALRTSLAERLETRAAAVATSLQNEGQGGLQESDIDGGVFVAVVGAEGTLLDASAGAPSPLPVTGTVGPARELLINGTRYLVKQDVIENGTRIVVGAPLTSIDRSQASLAGLLGLAGLVAVLLSATGGWWLAGRTLRPVADITAEAAAIGASDLDRRLPEPRREDELGVLARTLNRMLDRIGEMVERQRSFVTAASHDLRTPLAALQTELELADRPDATPGELRLAMRAARDDAARISELASDLLQLARVSSQGRSLVRTAVDLRELVESVIRRLAPVADRAEVRISNQVESLAVHVDRVRLEQAIANVLLNAVTYSPAGGEVEITNEADRSADGQRFALTVLDRGSGVSPAEQDAIFEPFHRGHEARGNGAGLGLATARAAVDAHGGTLTVEARAGGGSAFRMRIPA